MDLREIEFAAEKFLEMCRKHPEICPHDYIYDGCGETSEGKFVQRYMCGICGCEKSEVYDR